MEVVLFESEAGVVVKELVSTTGNSGTPVKRSAIAFPSLFEDS